jgi:hypothetical protein
MMYPRPLARALLSVAAACLLLCACVTDLRVGIERAADAGAMQEQDGGDVGPAGEPCLDSACGTLPQIADTRCTEPEWVCKRNERGLCRWHDDSECPAPVIECEPIDCEGPLLLRPIGVACSDGSEPVCDLDPATGICGYLCPDSGACGTEQGGGCAADDYCWFKVGQCGAGSGGQCTPRPAGCDASVEPVCGCDGKTYGNACEAARAGVNVSFAGSCADEPQLCAECSGMAPDPGFDTIACPDGVHRAGPSCVDGGGGQCHWQWLDCPDTRMCSSSLDPGLPPGQCFGPDDCAQGETCEGASLCPCDAECFAPDTPGWCKAPSR